VAAELFPGVPIQVGSVAVTPTGGIGEYEIFADVGFGGTTPLEAISGSCSLYETTNLSPALDSETATGIYLSQLIPLSVHAVVALSAATTIVLYCTSATFAAIQGELTVLQVTG
jgi:hypothetical protein